MNRLGTGAAGIGLATALVLTGCASGSEENIPGSEAEMIITANSNEPENPLIPTNTSEVGGGRILDAVFAGLVFYEADGTPVNDMAESIETEDSTTFTVTVAEGHEFTNGEPVDAEAFVNAWQFGALASNAQYNSYFFEDFEGFSYEEDSEIAVEATGDYTFEFTLKAARSDFPLRLGYSAFYPLPDVAFEDIDAFGENPVGNGPYKLAGEGAWQHDVQVDLVKNEDYTGGRQPQNDGLTLKFYATLDAAYADLLSNNLDVIDAIPPANFATFEDDLGDRAINQPAAVFQSFTIPSSLDNYSNTENLVHLVGEEGKLRRGAISMSINREEITDVIFEGTRTPASDFTSPTIEGWTDQLEGVEVLEYNPEEAKRLWAEADAISPWTGTFQISYNADGGHQPWVDAVMNSVANTLGIKAEGVPYPSLADVRTLVAPNEATGKREIGTAIRTGWQADYPGLYNFLGPLYASGAADGNGSNDGDYKNPEFDALLEQGAAAETVDEANEYFQQAQEILLKDLPAIPLWYSNVSGGFAEGVENVEFDWHSVPLYYQITK